MRKPLPSPPSLGVPRSQSTPPSNRGKDSQVLYNAPKGPGCSFQQRLAQWLNLSWGLLTDLCCCPPASVAVPLLCHCASSLFLASRFKNSQNPSWFLNLFRGLLITRGHDESKVFITEPVIYHIKSQHSSTWILTKPQLIHILSENMTLPVQEFFS